MAAKKLGTAIAAALLFCASEASAALLFDLRPAETAVIAGDWSAPEFEDGIEVGLDFYRKIFFSSRLDRKRVVGGASGTVIYDNFSIFDEHGELVESGVTRTEHIRDIKKLQYGGWSGPTVFFHHSVFAGGATRPKDYTEQLAGGGYIRHDYDLNLYLRIETDTSPQPFTIQYRPIPEPSTWALLISGFAAAGATLRSRRRIGLEAAPHRP